MRLPEQVDQRDAMQRMLDAGISTRRGIMCSHREPAYRDQALRQPLPHSEEAQDRCILLPLFPGMTNEELVTVARALERTCSSDARAARTLASHVA